MVSNMAHHRVTSIFKPKTTDIEEQATINIFTVASGLLYEVRVPGWLPHLDTHPRVHTALRLHHDIECSPQYKEHC